MTADEIRPGDIVRARAYLERDAMAWPPGDWERPRGVWRDDLLLDGDLVATTAAGPAGGVYGPAAERLDAEVRRAPRAGRYGAFARELLETIVLTAVIFISIRIVVQNFRIEGQSMVPTLQSGEYLLVNKLSYRLGEPQRGDIIVFQAWESDKDFIKRVVAGPGDEVSIKESKVFVNGQPLREPYILAPPGDTLGPFNLGPDEYFVLGDNRPNSSDSRVYGPLNRDRIIGKAWLTYWPPEQIGLIPDSTTSFASTD
jgi:signal peptidase I